MTARRPHAVPADRWARDRALRKGLQGLGTLVAAVVCVAGAVAFLALLVTVVPGPGQ